jgi:hypothetical protein
VLEVLVSCLLCGSCVVVVPPPTHTHTHLHTSSKGAIHFAGGYYVATWVEGRASDDGKYVFSDGLEYHHPASEWTYCTPADRRFYTEVVEGDILPAGETQLTNTRPSPSIPHGCFDSGDGSYYDPKRGEIIDYKTGAVIRKARTDEVAWMFRKCAMGDGGAMASALRASLDSA